MKHHRRVSVLVALIASGCSVAQVEHVAMSDLPSISSDAMLTDIHQLASDEFEGRAPGTKGEQKASPHSIPIQEWTSLANLRATASRSATSIRTTITTRLRMM
jgi:hypothetical protein